MTKYTIVTTRLGMRFLISEDVDLLLDLESDPDVQQFSATGIKNYEQTKATVKRFLSNYTVNGLPCFLVFNLATDEFIGRAGFIFWENTGDIEVGYCLHKKYWGQGYATEILNKLLVWARKNISIEYISACVDVNNVASARVLEKCGMRFYKSEIEHDVEHRFYRKVNR